jgi:ubiquinone/menaquinone biosynthesis C-methylase UbiE
MGLFRKSSEEPLGVTMAGVKLGQRVLAVGTRDPKLVAQLAAKSGLTGRACIVDDDEARLAAAAAAIEREGALIEAIHAPYGMWPFDPDSFDVAVVPQLLPRMRADERTRSLFEVFRVLRPGGRVLVVEAAQRGGVLGLLDRTATNSDYEGPAAVLRTVGFGAVRQLAEADGVGYTEGVKRA